jgi:hypothetical protein
MPATPRQKLTALERLVKPAQVAVGRADRWIQRVKAILDSEDITVTNTQKAELVAAWAAIRTEADVAVDALPADLTTWEPPPELYTDVDPIP